MNKDDIIKQHFSEIGKKGSEKVKSSMTSKEYTAEMKRRSTLALKKRWGKKNENA